MPGDIVHNAYHWFEILMIDQWRQTKALYDGADVDVKAKVDEIFGGDEEVFVRKQNSENWVNVRIDDEEELEDKKAQLCQIMGITV